MKRHRVFIRISAAYRPLIALLVFGAGLFGLVAPWSAAPATAAVGINPQINYQGRLLTTAGATVPDGNYNMRFKIYQDGTGTSANNGGVGLKWTEQYQNNTSSQGVVVKNGYFSVVLGTYCGLDGTACTGGQTQGSNVAVDFNQSVLFVSIDIGGTTTGAPTYDGEMLPMKRLTANPYAFNSEKLGGLTKAGFVQNTTTPQAANIAVQSAAVATAVTVAVKQATSQTGDLIQLQDSNGNINASFNAAGNQLTLGRIASSGTVTQGKLVLADGTTDNFGLTLQSTTLTDNRTITFPDATGTVCLQGASACGFDSPLTFNNGLTRTANTVTLGGALNANTTLATSNSYNLTVTSDLSGGARSTHPLIVSQANDATNNNSVGLLQLSNDDTGSTAAVLNVSQAAAGIAITASGPASGTGLVISGITSGIALNTSSITSGTVIVASSLSSGTGISAASLTSGSLINAGGAGFTSGNGLLFNTTANALTSGKVLNVTGTAANISADYTGAYVNITPARNQTSGVRNDTGQLINAVRTQSHGNSGSQTVSGHLLQLQGVYSTNNGSGNMTISGDIANLSSNCTLSGGSCTDTANILELNQQYTSASGAVLNVLGAGTGNLAILNATNATANGVSIDVQSSSSSQYALNVTGDNGATNILYARADGNVGIGDTTPAALLTVGNGDLFQVSGTDFRLLENGGTPGFYGIFDVADLAANQTYTLPDATGTVCIIGSTSCSAAGTGYINNSTTQQTANFNIRSSAVGNVGAIIQGAASQTAHVMQVIGNSSELRVLASGAVVINPAATSLGSTNALTVTANSSTGVAISAGNTAGTAISATGSASGGNGVHGIATVNGFGVKGTSDSGIGVHGESASDRSGVFRSSSSTNSAVTLLSKANGSQPGDLFNLQANNGEILTKFNASGALTSYGTTTNLLGLATPVITSPNTVGVTAYYVLTATNAAGETIASNVLALDTSSATINWTQIPGATGYKLYRNTSNNFSAGSLLRTTITNGTTVTFADNGAATGAGLPPTAPTGNKLVVQAWGAQSGDLLQVQDSAGNPLVAIGGTGNTTINALLGVGAGANGAAQLFIQPIGTSAVGEIIKQYPGSSADLFQAQDSSGTPVFLVTSAGNITAQTGLTFAGASGTISTSTTNANLSIQANGTGSITLDSTGAGAVNIANTNANTVTIGNGSATLINLNSGTSTINIGTGAQARQVSVGTGGAAQTVQVGSNNSTSTLSLSGGNGTSAITLSAASTGTVGIGSTSGNNTIRIGATTSASGTQAITIGTNPTAGSTTNITIGSTVAGTTTLQSAGGINVTENLTLTAGKALTVNTDAFTDLTGSGLTIASGALTVDAISATGFFRNGGNSFGTAATLGTNDSFGLNFETAGTTQFSIDAAGLASFTGNVTVAASKSISLVGGATGTRPASPTEGMLYYDTTTKQLLTYANGKWQADRSTSTIIVGTSAVGGASTAVASKGYDGADFVNTSDTSAQTVINNAIAALPATGGSVYLMEGTYIVDGNINLPNNTTLIGAGANTVLKIKNSHNAAIKVITNSDTTTGTRVNIQNLRIDGNKANQSGGAQYGISLSGMGAGSGSTARDGAKITNVTVRDVLSDGIYLSSSSNNTIIGNTVQGSSTGIYLSSSSNNTITGNTAQGNIAGLYIFSSHNNTLTGNTIQGNTDAGVYFDSSNHNLMSSNKLHDNGGATVNEGLYLYNNSDSNSIIGNDITDTSCTTTCYAITIFDAASGTNYLADNRFSTSAGTATINDTGTGTIYANQSTGANGTKLVTRTANDAAAFSVQNAAGAALLTVDSTNSKVIAAALEVTGTSTLTGNVGIGDATPAALLTVGNGDLFQVSSTGVVTYVNGTADSTTQVCRNGAGQLAACTQASGAAFVLGGNSFSGTGGTARLGTNNADSLALETNNVIRLTLDTSGNLTLAEGANKTLSIATAAAGAGNQLSVTAGAAFSGTGGALALAGGAAAGTNQTGGAVSINGGAPTGTGGIGHLLLQGAGGNVGIGTATPDSTLHVVGDINNTTGYRIGGTLVVKAPINSSFFVGPNTGNATLTGTYNLGLGLNALQGVTSGSNNTALGQDAMTTAGLTGNDNVAIGGAALAALIGGYENTAIGRMAMQSVVGGFDNSALGYMALNSNVSGNYNVAMGSRALRYSTGSNNTGIGTWALQSSALTGNGNTAVGMYAGSSITTGSNNTFLGIQSGDNDPVTSGFRTVGAIQGSTAIGYGAQVQASSSLVLGGAGGNQVNVGIGTTMPTNVLSVSPLQYSTGTAGTGGVSSTTVTGVGTTFTDSMIGSEIIFANGSAANAAIKATITGYTSATSITVSPAITVADGTAYRIHYPGLQVTSGGNVGIGTAAPAHPLAIHNGTNNNILYVKSTSTNTANILVDTTNSATQAKITFLSQGNGSLGYQIGNDTTNEFFIWQNSSGTSLIRSTNGGHLLLQPNSGGTSVGSTTTGVAKLYVDTDPGENLISLDVYQEDTTNNNTAVRINNAGTGASFLVNDDGTTTDTTPVIVDASGNLGVGLAAPTAQLHVSGAGGGAPLFKVSDTTATARDVMTIADGGATTLRNQTDSTAAFQVQSAASGTDVLTVDTTNSKLIVRSGVTTATIGAELLSGDCTGTNWAGTGSGPYTHTSGSSVSLTCTITGGVVAGKTYRVIYTTTGMSDGTGVTPSIGGASYSNASGNLTNMTVLLTATTTANPTFAISNTTTTGAITSISFKEVTAYGAALQVKDNVGTSTLDVRTSASGASSNIYIGLSSGQSSTNLTADNTAVGNLALQASTSGLDNSAFGSEALRYNTTGEENSAFGYMSLQRNAIGDNNAAFGSFALRYNTSGSNNAALGISALEGNINGNYNVAVGDNALSFNDYGSENVAIGASALNDNGSGDSNTAVGNYALALNSGGTNNLALGYTAGYQDSAGFFSTPDNLQNASAIGAHAQVQASNSMVLGSIDTLTKVGIGTTIPLNNFSVSPVDFNTSTITASQSASTVTASAAAFTAAMIGEQLMYADGTDGGTITGYTSTTVVTVSTSQTVSSKRFRTHHIGLHVTSAANVGIGNSAPGVRLHVQNTIDGNIFRLQDSDGTCNYDPEAGSVTVSCSSDGRLKSSIVNAASSLDYLRGLQVREYTVNASGSRMTGLIAQEALLTHPELVSTGTDGYYQVSEISSWKMVKAIQELDQEQAILESQLGITQNQVDGIAQLLATGSFSSIVVSGAATLATLTVEGSAEVQGNLKVVGILEVTNITVNGKIVTKGAQPVAVLGVATGTSNAKNNEPAPTVTVSGNDSAGTVTVTTGQTIPSKGVLAEITFAQAYAGTFKVSLTAVNDKALDIHVYVEKTATGFRIVTKDIPANLTQYQFDYITIGAEN